MRILSSRVGGLDRRSVAAGLVLAAAAASGLAASTGTASATPAAPTAVEERCGYFPIGMYRHCDHRTWVSLNIQDFTGHITTRCVGPGVSDLQPGIEWRVTGAWFNGYVCRWLAG